jgi:HEAT repeat protein
LRRTLLGLVVAITLLIGFFLVYFSFSGFRSHGQSYLTSLGDFCFMVDSYRRQSFDSPAELDDASFAAVLDRFRQGSHWEVRERAVWALRHWGPAVAPRLLAAAEQAADPYLQVGIAKGLVAIRDPRAATVVSTYLERYLDDPRRFRSDFVDLLGATGDPRALPTLIALHRRHGERVGDLLEAIGKCGGTDYLLAELNQATTAEEVRKLLWPLTYTRDPRGLKAVARQLTHQDESVRTRAYSALGQSSGGEVVAPLLEVLAGVENEYILGSALNMVLARPVNRGQSGLAPYLAGLFDHPTLAWEARYALARVGGDEALQVLRERMAGEPPDSVMQHLDLLGGAALPFLEHYLDSPDSWVRHQALSKVEELLDPAVRPLLTPLLEDPDPGLRRRVSHILFDMDSLDLFRSFTLSLPEKFGRAAWRGFRADLSWGLRKSFRQALTTLTLLHWLGLAVSALLGLLLACNRVRIFEAYRFNLFVSFLLCEGLFGNYFFLGQELNRPQLVFTLATGVHLLLLIGYLFQERERLPGELRNRFERLGGASLWLLTPPLLYFGPSFAP